LSPAGEEVIGQKTALTLADGTSEIMIASRDCGALRETAALIERKGRRPRTFVCDGAIESSESEVILTPESAPLAPPLQRSSQYSRIERCSPTSGISFLGSSGKSGEQLRASTIISCARPRSSPRGHTTPSAKWWRKGCESRLRTSAPGRSEEKSPLVTFEGGGLRPGIDLDDSASLLGVMATPHSPSSISS
jgi:hypothetical protein